MNAQTEITLLPCPFCGGEAKEIMGLVGCEPCALARRDVESWNRRAHLTKPDAGGGEAESSDVRPEVQLALDYSRNFAAAKVNIGSTEKEHILGLCDLLERTAKGLPLPKTLTLAVAEAGILTAPFPPPSGVPSEPRNACLYDPDDVAFPKDFMPIDHPTPVQGEALPVVGRYLGFSEWKDAEICETYLAEYPPRGTDFADHAQATAEISRLQGELCLHGEANADLEQQILDLRNQLTTALAESGEVREALQYAMGWIDGDELRHSHEVDGVWDTTNPIEYAGKPCEQCSKHANIRRLLARHTTTQESAPSDPVL